MNLGNLEKPTVPADNWPLPPLWWREFHRENAILFSNIPKKEANILN